MRTYYNFKKQGTKLHITCKQCGYHMEIKPDQSIGLWMVLTNHLQSHKQQLSLF
jgi:hypothetical protein